MLLGGFNLGSSIMGYYNPTQDQEDSLNSLVAKQYPKLRVNDIRYDKEYGSVYASVFFIGGGPCASYEWKQPVRGDSYWYMRNDCND